jgi:hypothetical protein
VPPVVITTRDLCEKSLFEINVLAAGEVMGADDAVYMLGELNTLLDELNAERAAVYADVFLPFTLVGGLYPHTIGPSGTFVVTQRPETIESCAIQVGTFWVDVAVRDRQWFQSLGTPATSGPQPSDVFYNPLWPNGELNWWPRPTTAAAIEFCVRQVLDQLALTDTFSLPPGYRSMLQKTLAERVAAPYEKTVPAQLAKDAAMARARVFGANTEIPRLFTNDSGIPGGAGRARARQGRGGGGAQASRWSE